MDSNNDNNILQLSSILNNVITNYQDSNSNSSSDNPEQHIRDCFKHDATFWNSFELFYYIHLGLAISYGILCLLCVIHFFYKLYNSSSNHNWHNWFYPLLFIGSAARGVLMIYMFMPPPTYGFILTLFVFIPSFVFFSAYLIILLRWAQIYHNSYEMSSLKYEHLRIMFYVVNAVMYTAMTALLVLQVVKNKNSDKMASMCAQSDDVIGDAISILCSALYILTPLGFMLYTFRITRKFRFLPSRSPAKREVSRKLQRFTLLVVLVFFCRAVVIFCFDINHKINYSIKYPWSDGVYYFVLEIIPLVLMFLILRMHTSKNMDSHSSGPSATTPLINHTLAFV